MDIGTYREEIRRLVAEAPDEPTYCEFKRELRYRTKREKAELVKDVSSFANVDLEALGGCGYLIFGVAPDGEPVGIGDLLGDPPSELRRAVNESLSRSVLFEYLTCEVDAGADGTKCVAAVVVPDSKRRPHVTSREVTEQQGKKTIFWLRAGEVWIRKTGGRELATAEDLDAMYEGKLRNLVEDRMRPIQERVERLERDLHEQKSVVPEIAFGLALPGSMELSPEGEPLPVLGNLVTPEWIDREVEWARERALARRSEEGPLGPVLRATIGPTANDFEEYGRELETWRRELEDFLVVEFVIANTGRAPAEDVEVVVGIPAELRPKQELPDTPYRPRDSILSTYGRGAAGALQFLPSKQSSPDTLIGPEVNEFGTPEGAEAVWEVGKLYHDRPLFTHSDTEGVGGLLIYARGYEKLLPKAGGTVDLSYTVRAANVPDALNGVLTLR